MLKTLQGNKTFQNCLYFQRKPATGSRKGVLLNLIWMHYRWRSRSFIIISGIRKCLLSSFNIFQISLPLLLFLILIFISISVFFCFALLSEVLFFVHAKKSIQKKPCPKTCSLREYPRFLLLLALTQTRFTHVSRSQSSKWFAYSNKSCESRRRLTGSEIQVDIPDNKLELLTLIEGAKPL